MASSTTHGPTVLFAASLVSMVLGSIHAFSVFLAPLEAQFAATRATISLVYSFGLVFLTATVLLAVPLYRRLPPATVYLVVATLGALGAAIAGTADSLGAVFLGYSLIFGVCNGLGYGYGLQFAARANPDRAGMAMGVVTAAYALGAVIAPYGFDAALGAGGFGLAMTGLGSAVFAAGGLAALLLVRSRARYSGPSDPATGSKLPARRLAIIWVAYGSGVSAGLMAIGHAAGIADLAGTPGWLAAAVVAGCNLLGSLLSGWLSDKSSPRVILTILPLLGAVGLFAPSVAPSLTIIGLGLIGFAYGGTIAAYPAAIATLFPGDDGPRAYGRIFTAWGAAGLLAPWFAGQIFDWQGTYVFALWLAAGLAVVSSLTVRKGLRAA